MTPPPKAQRYERFLAALQRLEAFWWRAAHWSQRLHDAEHYGIEAVDPPPLADRWPKDGILVRETLERACRIVRRSLLAYDVAYAYGIGGAVTP